VGDKQPWTRRPANGAFDPEQTRGSFGLDVCGPDHLAALVGLFRNKLGIVGGRARKRGGAKFGDLCLHLGVGEGGTDLWRPLTRTRVMA
jgi:hypothetical protein